ncbi:Hint domain-containing protein [Tabrizicola sp. M-4]|uniref:Hint domain-containing protein n=1 Tax=Tabrizicola sp. M-4 TaxID=3055847 RepID=UPI003DA92E95
MDLQEKRAAALDLAERVFLTTDLACFAAGTRIETAEGLIAVEDLREGMRVETMDRGLQPLRRVLAKTVSGMGALAPVVIEAGVLGNGRALRLSPHHRMVVSGWRAELLTGEPEVLAKARDLLDGRRVRVEPVAEVTYFHLLFDRHEIVFAEGAASESYHPFADDAAELAPGTLAEIAAIYPDLGRAFWEGTLLGGAVRPCARPEEAALLLG